VINRPHFLQTLRLRLRAFDLGDVTTLCAMHCDPKVRALLMDDHPLDDPGTARAFILGLFRLHQKYPGYGIWHCARVVDAGWRFCGWANLLPVDGEPDAAEIGCRLLPEAWGSGTALDIGHALLNHAFEHQALPRVLGYCHPDNRSVKLTLLALGFSDLGLGRYGEAPACVFEVRRSDWLKVRDLPRKAQKRAGLLQLRSRDVLTKVL
jgi:RimJ/RimL family protein N-acetyltransferase